MLFKNIYIHTMGSLTIFTDHLGYTFKDKNILIRALTHPSYPLRDADPSLHYERLELLGDAILGFIMKDILFHKHPDYREGRLSQKFALLTSKEYCYKVGKNLGVQEIMRISKGEEKNGGRALKANIANTVEAVLSAIYLDSKSLDICRNVIEKHWAPFLDIEDYLDPKMSLQEWSQDHLKTLPKYTVVSKDGPEHQLKFIVKAELSNGLQITGEGRSKKIAEKRAAKSMIKFIEPNVKI